uniref:Uncharacterized protein n=1 Tax=Anguilla anguilla TaxID=7936 RepID=A0A0E9U4R1_ANGAN
MYACFFSAHFVASLCFPCCLVSFNCDHFQSGNIFQLLCVSFDNTMCLTFAK